MRLFALCAQGVEDIVLDEINGFGKTKSVEIYKGLLIFDFEGDAKKLLHVKTAEDILIFIKKFSGITRYRSSLKNIRHQTAKAGIQSRIASLNDIRKIKNTFSVLASYKGRRDYTSAEIEKAAIESISNKGLLLSKEYGLLFRVILTNEISLFGLCIANFPLDETNQYLTAPGSLKPSLANALIKISEAKKGESLLDPMCGTGVIPIESSKQGIISIGGDIDNEKIELAKTNRDMKKSNADFYVNDTRETGFEEGKFDKIASNLPFGKQVSSEALDEKFFQQFLSEMIRVSKKGSTFVFLTAHVDILSGLLEKNSMKKEEVREIVNSGLVSYIIKIKKA